MFGIDVR